MSLLASLGRRSVGGWYAEHHSAIVRNKVLRGILLYFFRCHLRDVVGDLEDVLGIAVNERCVRKSRGAGDWIFKLAVPVGAHLRLHTFKFFRGRTAAGKLLDHVVVSR